MEKFDPNDIEEIIVRLKDGTEVVYKGGGIKAFQRLVSVPAGGVTFNSRYASAPVIEYSRIASDEDPIAAGRRMAAQSPYVDR